MADTHDTINGLLAEFRGYSHGMPPSYHVTMSWADFRRMLDRFDAAHRREREVTKSPENVNSVAASDTAGDCAKLREAIAKCVNLITEFGNAEIVKTPLDVIIDIEAILKDALAAPARNCDRYTTPNDAMQAFEAFVRQQGKLGFINPYTEAFKWLYAPATEKEGESDGNE